MECFRINEEYRKYSDWADDEEKQGFGDRTLCKEYRRNAEVALSVPGTWKAVAVLYSYEHGLTGEAMHFVRIDTQFTSYDGTIRSVSEHKSITNTELEELKRSTVGKDDE